MNNVTSGNYQKYYEEMYRISKLLRLFPRPAALALSAACGGTSPARVRGNKEWI